MPQDRVVEMRPVKGDVTNIPPPCPEGWWIAEIAVDKIGPTKKEGWPMISLEYTLEKPDDPNHERYAGITVNDWLIFFPDDHKAVRSARRKICNTCNAAGIDISIIPLEINDKRDLVPFADALDKQKVRVFIRHQEQNDQDINATISFQDNDGNTSLPTAQAAEVPQQAPPPAAPRTSTKNPNPQGKTRRAAPPPEPEPELEDDLEADEGEVEERIPARRPAVTAAPVVNGQKPARAAAPVEGLPHVRGIPARG